MKRILSNRKTLYFVLSVVLVFVFTLTIAYAALNTVLKITGNAEVVASNWDIYLDNVQIKSGSVGGVAPKITSSTTATFSTKLTTPGDFYEFSIDVVNDGSIDAVIDSVTKTPTLTESQTKYLSYIIEYQNGNSISTNQLVETGSYVRLRVRVEYRKDLNASNLPTSNDNLSLSFTVNYVQSDNRGNAVLNNGTLRAFVKNGTGTNVGDEICIGNECFYVISSTENDVTMLAKYNLHVGNRYDDTNGLVPLENIIGIQDEKAKGWFSGYTVDNPIIGTNLFSSTNYWSSIISNYPAYVYNENSYLYENILSYKIYLEKLGSSVSEARLITLEELEVLGCSSSNNSCSEAPSWVYSTTYWSGAAYSSTNVWCVSSDSYFRNFHYTYYSRGVRPVITISKDQILGIKNKVKPIANDSLDEVGTVVTIGTEQFYTIGTEGDNVKLLAKYNLLVGNKYDKTNGAVPLENPTGVQDKRAKGWFSGYTSDNPLIATKKFSNINYWSSTVNEYPAYIYNEKSYSYEYVENYKSYLENLGIKINESRLITIEELIGLGCNISSFNCKNAPEWVYSTTYWTGNAYSSEYMWNVDVDTDFYFDPYTRNEYGTRPVIVVPKSQF